MIDPQTADAFRYIYAALAVLTCTGFAMTLVLRWEVLHLGERLLRVGLILEHMVIIYGAYLAIDRDFPPSLVGISLTGSLTIVVIGFVVWLADLVLGGQRNPQRLTDR